MEKKETCPIVEGSKPAWTTPTINRIDIKRTLSNAGSVNDAGNSGSL